jgi:hypothetical protein
LAICAFDIQSGWIDAYERQREYMRRDLSWENSTQKNSVKDCKISTGIWIISPLKKQVKKTK